MVKYVYYSTKLIKTEALVDKIMNNKVCRELIHTDNNEFEVPGVAELAVQLVER